MSFPKYNLSGGCSNQPGVKFQGTSSEPLEFIAKGDKLPQLTGLSYVTSKSWENATDTREEIRYSKVAGGDVYVCVLTKEKLLIFTP